MAMFGLFGSRKKTSSSIAKDRLKLVLIHDRAGTSSNNEMIEMMKRDILRVISEYIEIDDLLRSTALYAQAIYELAK